MFDLITKKSMGNIIVATAIRMEKIGNHSVFEPIGLSASSFHIMYLLSYSPRSPIEITKILNQTKSNITQRIKLLIDKGLVEKIVDNKIKQKDGRRILFKLTDPGKKKTAELLTRLKKYQIRLEQEFSQAELETFFNLFKKINQLLKTCDCPKNK